MAHWNPAAANDLMAFAANHHLTGMVNVFQANVDNWANNLGQHTTVNVPFGGYNAEVTGDTGQVLRIQFDL